mgnify:CR=1 FL=1
MTSAIATDHLTKRFGRKRAVDDLMLDVPRGEVFCFLGRNGAGKSTTIRMLLGLVRPSAGAVSILGKPIRFGGDAALRKVGAIVEQPAFYESLSAERNLKYYHYEKEKRNEKIQAKFSRNRDLEQLQNDLRMERIPRHIECFDNSNIQGQYPVAACVVFRNGKNGNNRYPEKHIQRYLDEFVFRFNRRWKLENIFDKLLYRCILTTTITYAELTG